MTLGEGKGWKAYANFLLVRLQRKHKTSWNLGCPYLLLLDPSSYCNLQCPFCPTGQRNKQRSYANLPLDRFKHLMDELGSYLFYLDLFNWGEPFINKDLVPMIEYLRPFGIFSSVSTNFDMKMTEGLAERIVASGLSRLIISADGASQESYERYRVGGRLDTVLRNIKLVAGAKQRSGSATPRIYWRFLVFRHNEHEIDRAKGMAEEMGVELDLSAPYVPVHDARYRDWVSTIPYFNKYTVDAQGAPQHLKVGPVTKDGVCDWLWVSAAINSNGSVSPCCGIWEEKYDFGRIGERGFRGVWNSRSYRAARSFMRNGAPTGLNLICEQCPIPDIWNHSSHYDPLILDTLCKKLPAFVRGAIGRRLRTIFY
jgi:radical SAM protein with 4Fe4S-binding SPASM domain